MAAARAFLAERKDELPVAVIVFGSDDLGPHGLHDGKRTSSPRPSPSARTKEGTHIYDALTQVAASRRSRVRAHDGRAPLRRHGHRQATQEGPRRSRRRRQNIRVISVGLQSPEYNAETLKALARRPAAGTSRRDAGAARADFRRDRPAALERVRGQLSLAPPAQIGDGAAVVAAGGRRRPPSTRLPRSTSRRRARSNDLGRRDHYVAMADDLRDRLRSSRSSHSRSSLP